MPGSWGGLGKPWLGRGREGFEKSESSSLLQRGLPHICRTK